LLKDTKTKQNNATKMAKKHTLRQGTKLIQSLNSLDGVWSEDKEAFKSELLNDIKTFLFTKWEKPWRPSLAVNKKGEPIPFSNIHGRAYEGQTTTMLLQGVSKESPFFVTFDYIKKNGGKVTNDKMKTWAVGWIAFVKDDENVTIAEKDDKKIDFMLPQYTRIISTDYVTGIKVPFFKIEPFKEKELNLYIETIIYEMKRRKRLPVIIYDQKDSCHYRPLTDSIHMVQIMAFNKIESYYSTLFHEIVHSTKSPERLMRTNKMKKRYAKYAAEELVAEMGACILCAELGLNYFRKNTISYLKGWLSSAVKNSNRTEDDILLEAYGYAVDAVEYLLGGIDVKKLVPNQFKNRVKEELREETETKQTKQVNKSSKIDIVDYPIKDISTDVKRFQNRQNEYSKESKVRIVKAFDDNTFDWAKFDPITLWKDPKNNKVYILSGHSRFAAFKEKQKEGFVYNGYKFDTIPAKFFNGTEKQAIDFALNSSILSTKETDIERAVYYSNMRRKCEISQLNGTTKRKIDCAKKVETKCRENEGKNANFILNLSYLNPDGKLMQSLKMFGSDKDNDNTNLLRTIANWTGEARRTLLMLTDTHENEISDFLINGGYGNKSHQFKNKTVFLEYLKIAIKKWESSGANVNTKLNLERTIYKSSYERDHDKQILAAKEEMDSAFAEYDEKYKKYLSAVWDGEITQERMNELMLPLVAYAKKTRDNYNRVKGQKSAVIEASNRQGTLFGVDTEKILNDLRMAKKMEQVNNIDEMKDIILYLFHKAAKGSAKGMPIKIGDLTKKGRDYLSNLSKIDMKPHVSFVVNPSELRHIYNEHYEINEKDTGSNYPLTDKDIRNIIDVMLLPEKIVSKIEKGLNKFVFLAQSSKRGSYNLIEIYSNKRGNLSVKSLYNTKKDVTHRAITDIKQFRLFTSKTSGAILSDTKIPQLFEFTKSFDKNTIKRVTGWERDTNGKWWYKTTKGKISADELIKKIS